MGLRRCTARTLYAPHAPKVGTHESTGREEMGGDLLEDIDVAEKPRDQSARAGVIAETRQLYRKPEWSGDGQEGSGGGAARSS